MALNALIGRSLRAGRTPAVQLMRPLVSLNKHTAVPQRRFASFEPNDNFTTQDGLLEKCQRADTDADPSNRAYTYMMMGSGRFIQASIGRLMVVRLIGSMQASADVLAMGQLEVDMGGIAETEVIVVKWRGKPVFIKHRSPAEISAAAADDKSEMRDPQPDSERWPDDPKWVVVMGSCTHLGCVPVGNKGLWEGGWFCPCHGSHYDNSGRIRKGPAPLNLEIPVWAIRDGTIVLG